MASKTGGRRSGDGDYLLVVGIVALALFWPRISGWAGERVEDFAGSDLAARVESLAPVLLASLIVLAVILLWRAVLRGSRRKQRDILVAVVGELLPKSWESDSGLRIRWRLLTTRARKVVIVYPPESSDRDPEWVASVVDAVAYRASMPGRKVNLDRARLRLSVTRVKPAPEVEPTPEDRARAGSLVRVRSVLAPLFGAADIEVAVPEWTSEPDLVGGYPEVIEIRYDPTTRDASQNWRRRLEAVVALKVPPGNARWAASYETSADRIVLRHRPPLPEHLVHPGPSLWAGQPGIVLPYGVDENHELVAWAITGRAAKQRPTIHTLIIGATGAGKTSVMRSKLTAATGQGVWVLGADPKRVELTPFRGWPGVLAVGSTAEDLALVIKAAKELMDARYQLREEVGVNLDSLAPVVLFIDELLILRGVLNRWWNANKGDETLRVWGTKAGTRHPALGMVTEMLALARTANIRLVEGVQRPDASLFEEGSRDNLRHRISLNRLSKEGAEMLWDDSYTGTDTPLVAGRGMASPDGTRPVETQMFWTPDPMDPDLDEQEAELLNSLRAAAEKAFEGREIPEGLDLSKVSATAQSLPERAPADAEVEPVVEHTDDLSTQLVGAGEIMQGDRLLTDEGVIVEVVACEQIENPDEPSLWDWVRMSLRGPSGEVQEEAPSSAGYARIIGDW